MYDKGKRFFIDIVGRETEQVVHVHNYAESDCSGVPSLRDHLCADENINRAIGKVTIQFFIGAAFFHCGRVGDGIARIGKNFCQFATDPCRADADMLERFVAMMTCMCDGLHAALRAEKCRRREGHQCAGARGALRDAAAYTAHSEGAFTLAIDKE